MTMNVLARVHKSFGKKSSFISNYYFIAISVVQTF